jgi:sugar phosphate isomerase/epimerase
MTTIRRAAAAAALVSALLAAPALPAADAPAKAARNDAAAEKLGWRLSMASYTLRAITFMEEIDAIAPLGLKYVDIHPSAMQLSKEHPVKTNQDLPAELRELMKKKMKEAGIRPVSYGMVNLGGTEASARKVFAFAKDMGIENIVCEAKAEQMEMLDKLTEEYGINIALHNHPKPSIYWDAETVLKAVEGRGKRIGACADTGHWQRSGLVPLDCLKALKGRIISFHFKDVVEAGKGWQDVPWGTGKSDAKAMLAELKSQGFKGVVSIEYEHGTGQALLDDVAKCIAAFDKMAEELAK